MAKNKDLLSFLFGESAEVESAESDSGELNLAENLERLFEVAAEAEQGELKAKKTPLAKALSEFGISDSDLQLDPEGFCFVTDNHENYVNAVTVLSTADAMHKLAEMGWVVTKPGDDAMTNEPPNYRIRFLEITTVDQNDRDPKGGTYDTGNREEVIKKAQEFATAPMDREDELNPVENEDGKMGEKKTGIGDPKDGSAPEGKPKGSTKKTEESVTPIEEFTSTGSMGTAMSQGQPFIGMVKKPKPYGKGTKFKTPGQWKVKQPVVDQQVKRKVKSESVEFTEQAAEKFLKEEGPGDVNELSGQPKGLESDSEPDFGSEGAPQEDEGQQMYQDMLSDLETGECAVFSDRGSGPTTVTLNGKLLGHVGREFDSWEDALASVNAAMEEQKYWPNIYHVNDHGNVSLLNNKGEIIRAWV